MPFPNTDYPDALDVLQSRTDNVDVVWDDDVNFIYQQNRKMQEFVGLTGGLIGQGIAGKGSSGMVSAVASGAGAKAFRLAARNSFAAGDILSVGDAFDAVYTEKMRLDYTGLLWALAGIDASAMLKIPAAGLPPPGVAGRLQWNTALSGLYYDDGVSWIPVGGASAGSYPDWATGYTYTEAVVPVEEVIGGGVFDGSEVIGSLVAYFRAIVSIIFLAGAGPSSVRLYDMGPKAGPPAAPVLITTLTTAVAGGPQVLEQALAVGALPGANQIASSARMYEVTAYQLSSAGDSIYIGSAGLDVR